MSICQTIVIVHCIQFVLFIFSKGEEQQQKVPEDVQNQSISKALIDSDTETAMKDVEINEPGKR